MGVSRPGSVPHRSPCAETPDTRLAWQSAGLVADWTPDTVLLSVALGLSRLPLCRSPGLSAGRRPSSTPSRPAVTRAHRGPPLGPPVPSRHRSNVSHLETHA